VPDAPSADELQQRYRQFLELTPLATALAGLPPSGSRLHQEDQIEARSLTVRTAYRAARALAEETSGGDPQKYRQFLDLLPLTVALAGLPLSEGRLFGEDQIDARVMTVRSALRQARATAKECLGGS
jgi:hypothetical protein